MKNILKRIISKYENVVMNDKRILRIIHTLDPTLGGPSNVIIDNSLALIKKGYSIHILTSDKYYCRLGQ